MKGGGYTTSYARNIPSNEDDCNLIDFYVNLHDLQSSLENYKMDEILVVKLDDEGLVYVTGHSGLLGYVPAVESSSLIKCIRKGKKFRAHIISISAKRCYVRILPN